MKQSKYDRSAKVDFLDNITSRIIEVRNSFFFFFFFCFFFLLLFFLLEQITPKRTVRSANCIYEEVNHRSDKTVNC